MIWSRLSIGAVVLTIGAATATAQPTNAQRADQLNDEGKAAMQDNNFAVASERFHQAIVLSREGRFYFNLCVSLYQEGKFGEALAACNAVESAGADDALKTKTAKMTTKLKDDMRKQGFDPDAPVATDPVGTDPNNPNGTDPNNPNGTDPNNPNGTDPNNPNGTNPNGTPPVVGTPPAVGTPPVSLFKAVAPAHAYTWTLGAELLGGSSAIGSQGTDVYTGPMFGVRFLGDYLIAPAAKFGAQASISVLHSNTSDSDGTVGIDIVDIGLAGYKHFCGKGRICFTPLVGIGLGLMQPDGVTGNDALMSIGVRAEARVGFALGQRFEHLLSVTLGFQGYTQAFDSSAFDAEEVALDGFSKIGLIALGYTYRFNTPFGSSPFVTLE